MNDKLPFRAINYWLFGLGCLLLVVGFVLSAVAPWNNPLSLTPGSAGIVRRLPGGTARGIAMEK